MDAEREIEVMAAAVQQATSVLALLSNMMSPEEADLVVKACDEYDRSTQGMRTLAALFGRPAINQQDLNAQQKMPVLRKFAEVVREVHELNANPQVFRAYGDSLFDSFMQGGED